MGMADTSSVGQFLPEGRKMFGNLLSGIKCMGQRVQLFLKCDLFSLCDGFGPVVLKGSSSRSSGGWGGRGVWCVFWLWLRFRLSLWF